MIVERAVFFFFEMLLKGSGLQTIAKGEVDRKESAEPAPGQMEVVEVSVEAGTGWIYLWAWIEVRVRMYLTKMVRACLAPSVSKSMKGLVVVTDAWVAYVEVWDMALWMNIADSLGPWTWALDKVTTAGEDAGNGRGNDIDSLGNMAAAAEDEGKARRENYAQVGHCEEEWLVAPAVKWAGVSSWSNDQEESDSQTLSAAISL